MWTRNDEDAARDADHRAGKHEPFGRSWCSLCPSERSPVQTAHDLLDGQERSSDAGDAVAMARQALRDALREEEAAERARFARAAAEASRRSRLVEYDRADTLEALRVECSRDDGEGTYEGLWEAAHAVLAAHGLEVENL